MKETYIEDFEKWQKDFTFYEDIEVRFSETDMLGHLNNSVPFIYFESARMKFMGDSKLFNDFTAEDNPIVPVVADIQCDFLGQIFFGETVRIYTKYTRIGNSSVEIHYMGVVSGDIRLTGRGTVVQMDSTTGRSSKWTTEQLDILKSINIY
ncbi:acyl-CoA thioesterase [Kurthia sibirica]|nr:thioesterase family protein [Kurthia sibirica]GEK33388.1 4-hydroxybenzoyl-CoA thioesterase [Kurthia sibirica]